MINVEVPCTRHKKTRHRDFKGGKKGCVCMDTHDKNISATYPDSRRHSGYKEWYLSRTSAIMNFISSYSINLKDADLTNHQVYCVGFARSHGNIPLLIPLALDFCYKLHVHLYKNNFAI